MLDNAVVIAMISGFAGAACAFLFMRLESFLKAYTDRAKLNYRALLRLEYFLNSMLDRVNQHATDLRHLAETYRSVDPPKLALTFSMPQEIIFDDTYVGDLGNNDLVNDFVAFSSKLYRINRDSKSIRDAYRTMLERALEGQIDSKAYQHICHQNIQPCEEVAKYTDQFIEDLIDLMAKVRVRIRIDRPLFNRLYSKLPGRSYGRDFNEDVRREREKLRDEITDISNESQLFIDKIFSSDNQRRRRD